MIHGTLSHVMEQPGLVAVLCPHPHQPCLHSLKKCIAREPQGRRRGASKPTHAVMSGIEATLQKQIKQIVSSVQQEEERLKAQRQAIQTDRAAMEAELKSKTEKLDQERATFEAEKKSVAATNQSLKSKVKLNVGGSTYDTSRTTLTSVPGSMLEAWFSGRHALEEDKEDGRIFIDRDGAAFKLVLEYLRSPTKFTLEGLSKREVASCLAEFEYYQLPSPVPPVPPLDLKMSVYQNGYTTAQIQDDKCIINQSANGGWAWAVGAEVLADDAVWKLRIEQQHGVNQLMTGVIANAHPPSSNAHSDGTFAGWGGNNYFYANGGTNQGSSGWPGWQNGDEAIFALNASTRTLTVHLKRTGRCYTYTNLQGNHLGQWRVCVDTCHATRVILSQPTDEECALVK